MVCDLKNAEKVAHEIRGIKGDATALSLSVEDGEAVVNETIKTYGRIDVVVNNAGILRDKAFQNMTGKLSCAQRRLRMIPDQESFCR